MVPTFARWALLVLLLPVAQVAVGSDSVASPSPDVWVTNDAVIFGMLITILTLVFWTHSLKHPFWVGFYKIFPLLLLFLILGICCSRQVYDKALYIEEHCRDHEENQQQKDTIDERREVNLLFLYKLVKCCSSLCHFCITPKYNSLFSL